jgi:hypothetical protein
MGSPRDPRGYVVGPASTVMDALREAGLEHSTCDRGPWSEADQADWRERERERKTNRRELALRRATVEELARDANDGDLICEVIRRLMDKEVFVGTRTMSVAERTALLVNSWEFEVLNGGFRQFFFNSTGNCSTQTLDALRRVGQPALVAVYEQALAVFPSPPSEERAVRAEQLAALVTTESSEDDDPTNPFEECNEAFSDVQGEIWPALADYIRAHARDLNLPPDAYG